MCGDRRSVWLSDPHRNAEDHERILGSLVAVLVGIVMVKFLPSYEGHHEIGDLYSASNALWPSKARVQLVT